MLFLAAQNVLHTPSSLIKAASQNETQIIYVFVYNALSSSRSEVISLPVSGNLDASYIVERLTGLPNEWQQMSSTLITNANYADISGAAQTVLYFEASELLPVGGHVFRVTRDDYATGVPEPMQSSNDAPHLRAGQNSDTENDLVIGNGIISVHCDR